MRRAAAAVGIGVMAAGLAACSGGDGQAESSATTAAATTSRPGGSLNIDLSAPTAPYTGPTSSWTPRRSSDAAPTTAATMLDEVVARASEVAGTDAWGQTTTIRNIGPVLLVSTNWSSPAEVDQDAANLICGGLYTWIQESGRSWPGPDITSASLYGPDSQGGVQVFDC